MTIPQDNAIFDLKAMLRRGIAPRRRSILDWAEDEVILPNGVFKLMRYRRERHPAAVLLLEEMDHGFYRRYAVTGPVQDGKTLQAFIIPSVYRVVELGETIVVGGPSEDVLRDKWLEDFLPVMQASPRLRALLPQKGPGSKGSYSSLIQLRNGGGFRFMTGGGGDAGRAAFTTPTVAITEADKFAESVGASEETDTVTQLEARNSNFRLVKRDLTILECTCTVPQGRIHQAIINGSNASPHLGCVHCNRWVQIKREHLVGWQNAPDESAARERTRIACPSCGAHWTEEERKSAIRRCRLVHAGQTVDAEGVVQGERPQMKTMGFRWSDADSLMKSMEELGALEWKAEKAENRQNAEKEILQFCWGQPYVDPEEREKPLTVTNVWRRMSADQSWSRGRVPRGARFLVAGADVGKWYVHWCVQAVFGDGRRHVVDYGMIRVNSDVGQEDDLSRERDAISVALMQLATMLGDGFLLEGSGDRDEATTDEIVVPQLLIYDFRYQPKAVADFIAATGHLNQHLASEGFGSGQTAGKGAYSPPRTEDRKILARGDGWHVLEHEKFPVNVMRFDSDAAKQAVQMAFRISDGAPGSISLFNTETINSHTKYAQHLVAEELKTRFRPGVGVVTRLEQQKKQNHWLDATAEAYVAGEICLSSEVDRNDNPASPSSPAAPDPQPEATNALEDHRQPYEPVSTSYASENSRNMAID